MLVKGEEVRADVISEECSFVSQSAGQRFSLPAVDQGSQGLEEREEPLSAE